MVNKMTINLKLFGQVSKTTNFNNRTSIKEIKIRCKLITLNLLCHNSNKVILGQILNHSNSSLVQIAIGKLMNKSKKGQVLDQAHLPRSNTLEIHQVASQTFPWVETIMQIQAKNTFKK